ncbi:disintegrin and metalloproteinase domain-containing protein 19-like [Oncorhynchus clarkii lewisi]|uniref:disintegrin and metalloproteinase domain-containing protein 19-like n=1 Tax=Oncorhynchus clarkii lewisi TaxID=490388 RepID=UPI0039B85A20
MSPGERLTRFNLSSVYSRLSLYLIVVICCVGSFASDQNAAAEEQRSSPQENNHRIEHLESYEITYPHWLQPARHRRSIHGEKQHPSEAEVLITAEGEEMTLRLHRNEQLLAPGYQEIWYSPSGSRQISYPPSTGHCFYHGDIRGVEGSSVALSTCSGLRGLVTVNTSVSYLIEPLPAVTMDTQPPHAVFRAENLRLPNRTCGQRHSNQGQGEGLGDLIQGMMSLWGRRERRDVGQSMKYVELLLVADHAEFQKHGGDLKRTKRKLLEAANYVDKYYKSLSIRVAVIGLEVWSDQDRISVSGNPYSTLGAFLAWRRKQLHTLPNDNAQLITGVAFQGTTIGLAPLRAMCSEYQSGGVNSDHSDSAVGVAATMAHEMGHNFGMSHDSPGCCQAKADDGGCIMAAATGHPFPRVFNGCNQRELSRYLSSGGGKCLFNLPNTRAMHGGQRCGNGYLEDGEECDCGDEEECSSPCCNANNCTLKAGAECSHGVCCHNCKLKSPGVLCRTPSGSCDLPEYCDGKAESCPSNLYLVDGTSCAGGQAYCYTGMCLTLEQQCQSLWGRDGRAAPDLCFQKVNEAGDSFGNCGKDLLGKYRGCRDRDARCGKIQCVSSASKPLETNAVPIDTTVRVGNGKILCRGTHVYRPGQGDEEQGDTLDPGLVMTGTKCGEDSICFGGECRNASFLRADECNAKCHGHGLCNNNHHCHCDSGWAPPLCDQEGTGGSVDSGPVINHSSIRPVLLLLPLVLFVLLAAVGLWCCYSHKLHKNFPLKTSVPPPKTICPVRCSVPAEAKHLQANSLANGHLANSLANSHANPTFLLTRHGSDRLVRGSSPSTPCPSLSTRHPVFCPTVQPPPYIAQQRQALSQPNPQPSLQPQPQPSLQPQPQPSLQPQPQPSLQPQPQPSLQPKPQPSLQPKPQPSLQPQPPLPQPKPKPPPIPSHLAQQKGLLQPLPLAILPPSPQSSPSTPHTHRPDPPNRPPPPCPLSKPQISSDVLQRGKSNLAPPGGQKKPSRSQKMISGRR